VIEKEIIWGLVVEGDQIYSDRTKKWYSVTGSSAVTGTTKIKVFINGRAIPLQESKDIVRVRRGPTGDAVDVLQLIFSGQTMPEER
jgi:hypothetical protein